MQDLSHLRAGAIPAETCKVGRTQCYAVNIRHHCRCRGTLPEHTACLSWWCRQSQFPEKEDSAGSPASPLPEVVLVLGHLREKGVLAASLRLLLPISASETLAAVRVFMGFSKK